LTPEQRRDLNLWCAVIAELWATGRMTRAHESAERLWISVRLAGDYVDLEEQDR
jgi:hypothetical protein